MPNDSSNLCFDFTHLNKLSVQHLLRSYKITDKVFILSVVRLNVWQVMSLQKRAKVHQNVVMRRGRLWLDRIKRERDTKRTEVVEDDDRSQR